MRLRPLAAVPAPVLAAERKFYRSPGTIGNRDDGVAVGPADSLKHPDAGDGMMSSVGSTPEREALLESAFAAHLEALCERSARALTASGYTGLLVHSGSLLGVFEDDRTYPFEANAPFKVWSRCRTPRTASCGSNRGRYASDHPSGAGLLAQVHGPAAGLLEPSVRGAHRRRPSGRTRAPACRPLARGLHRGCPSGTDQLGYRRRQPAAPDAPVGLRACRQDAL